MLAGTGTRTSRTAGASLAAPPSTDPPRPNRCDAGAARLYAHGRPCLIGHLRGQTQLPRRPALTIGRRWPIDHRAPWAASPRRLGGQTPGTSSPAALLDGRLEV